MAYEFETGSVPHLIADAERLLHNATDSERRLISLLATLNGNAAAALESIRELRAAAGVQRQLAETVLARLVGPAADHTGPRALIVDDNHDNCDVAATALEASGFEVITAANGLDGVIAAHCAQPSIILMDVTMPVLDGLEATRLLKASSATRDINVIAYTAQPSFYQKAFASLFVAILAKPIDPPAMIAMVRKFAAAASHP
jgi:two-component system cell cycle response regulator DivK